MIVIKNEDKRVVLSKSSDKIYSTLLENIRVYFKDATHCIHKARNEIKVLPFNNKNVVVKSFKIPHIINKIAYTFFRDSKAKKSYINSQKIVDFVPNPIGYIEFSKFGLLHDSYFISEEFKYDFTIREPLLDDNFKDKELIFKQFATFTNELHQKGIEHLDYSPGNILIKYNKDGYIFKIIDINRMKFGYLNYKQRLQNFAKLWAKDDDLKIIIKAYAKDIDIDEALKIALLASQKHKDKKNLKKRLKGMIFGN